MADYDEHRLRSRESDLMTLGVTTAARFQNPQAVRHLRQGFYRRGLMMKESRFQINAIIAEAAGKNLDPYKTCDLNIHLNSYYIHIRGALDNLAWSLQYEFGLLPGVEEENVKGRSACSLFGQKFVTALRGVLPGTVTVLESKRVWEQELKTLRDPVAPRIPLYAIPGIATEQESHEIRHLHELASKAYQKGDLQAGNSYLHEAATIGQYIPAFLDSTPNGLRMKSIPEQMVSDFLNFAELCEALLKAASTSRA